TLTLTAALNSDLITYTGNIVANFFSGNPVVYYGFSSGTGSLSNLHTVCFGPPTLQPMADVTLCEGEDVQLQADDNGVSWTWAPNPTLSAYNISDPIADPVMTTTYTVAIDYACGGFARDTVVVTVLPKPTATADNSGPVCPGESIQLFASGGSTYHWNGPMGFNSNVQNPIINNMTIGKTGTYTVTVTDAFGCSDTAETEVDIYALPFVEVDPVFGSLCEDGDPIQLLGTPPGGEWSGEVDPNGVFDPGDAGEGMYVITYTITDANGCTNSDQITIKVVPNVGADIMPMGPFCLDVTVVQLTANPPGGTWGGIANSDGEIYPSSLSPGMYEVTYELVGQDECYNTTLFIEIVTNVIVVCPNVSPVCENSPPFQLTANPPGGTWSAPATPTGIVDPMALGPGDHQISYTYTAGACPPNTCWSLVSVVGAPSTQNVVEMCDGTGSNYTVTFNISGGDPSSYVVNGTTTGLIIQGNPSTFTSLPIPSGSNYSFQVFDANHCDTITINGAHACNCPTQAGTMDMTPISVCEGDTVHIMAPTGVVLDPNDTLIYVLHTGDPKNYLLAGNGNEFVFQPPLQLGIQYFISVLVGNTISGVGVDLNDPCLAVANGPTVIWNANPTGFLMAPPMVCTGDSALLSFVLTGTGPFNVTYLDGGSSITLDSIVSGYSTYVHPNGNTTYTLVLVAERTPPSCSSLPDTSLTIAVNDVIHAMQVLMMCDGDSIFLAGDFQHSQGVYFDSIPGTIGCDTILESYLLLNSLDTTLVNTTTCNAAQAGIFENVFSNQSGCDSTVITTVTLIAADTTLLHSTTCDPQAAGIFTDIFTGQSGCDSVVIEAIALLPSDTTHLSSGNCDIAATGTFTKILTNYVGCDSVIIETVFLLPSDTTWLNFVSCLPADTGTVSNLLQNVHGCDSLVVSTTSLIASWVVMDTSTTCDPAESGTYTSHFVSSQGCDSTYIEEVILLPSDLISIYDQTCETSDTGIVILHFTNQYGCDSTVQYVTGLLPPDSCIVYNHDYYLPNVFSPNDDGINDVFFVSSGPNSVGTVLDFRIYDRWGNLVFESKDGLPDDPTAGWNGKMADKNLNPGVFVWVVEIQFLDGKEITAYGDVTLVR
ncbi:MAG TPA: gliding motility-associated C-terminal domain-containing protein, partial [Saprospiraceae bacterium]|nr:gliding motility-associated C-terminal domain-containing protein [Saprospiraceae bacterium]